MWKCASQLKESVTESWAEWVEEMSVQNKLLAEENGGSDFQEAFWINLLAT